MLNQRKVLVMGPLDDRAAEVAIQKLLYLEGRSPQPIDLYIQSPGGEFKSAKAIAYVMANLGCTVNTYALSEWNSGGAVLLAAGTATIPLMFGGRVLQVGLASLELPLLGPVTVSSALAFDSGVYLAVVGMVLMAFEAFGEEPAGVTP